MIFIQLNTFVNIHIYNVCSWVDIILLHKHVTYTLQLILNNGMR